MPDDSNGNHSLPTGYLAKTGEKVLASQHNPPLEDLSAGMTERLMRDGRAPMLGPLNMNGYKAFGMGAGSANTDAATVGQIPALASAGIAAATEKATPVDADTVPLTDSAASSALKKLTWANIKATLKTYFDTLYQAVDTALLKAGGTMTGALVLNANPTADLGAATKQYVDKHPSVSTAWVTFDGTGSPIAPFESYNVSSITDRGLGAYTINFAAPMVNTGYVGVCDAINISSGGIPNCRSGTRTVNGMDIDLQNQATNRGDSAFVSALVFGGK